MRTSEVLQTKGELQVRFRRASKGFTSKEKPEKFSFQ